MSMSTNTLTNMITPAHRMSMTMITLMSTDCMIMIIPGTSQKNIHTIIEEDKQPDFNPWDVFTFGSKGKGDNKCFVTS
jgi:hypothetical protein